MVKNGNKLFEKLRVHASRKSSSECNLRRCPLALIFNDLNFPYIKPSGDSPFKREND